MMLQRFYEQRTRVQEEDGRTSWTIALAHGAGLATLGGLIGNVEDVNFAVAQLWPALTCFGAGLAFSVASVQRHAVVMAIQLGITVNEAHRERIIEQRGVKTTDIFAPLDLSGARHIYGSEEAAVRAYLDFVKASIERDREREAQLEAAFASSEVELKQKFAESVREKTLFSNLQNIAVVCAFAATGALVYAGVNGLQPKGKSNDGQVPAVASAPIKPMLKNSEASEAVPEPSPPLPPTVGRPAPPATPDPKPRPSTSSG
ncbi:hypothetical protein [Caulobacter sp.]|uniref:hypothetical protein n=1 Tax=Caulobacter sp. TaxID=78 RepID=UPI001623107F